MADAGQSAGQFTMRGLDFRAVAEEAKLSGTKLVEADGNSPYATYTRIADSFLLGMMGVWKARIVSTSLSLLLFEYRASKSEIDNEVRSASTAKVLRYLELLSLDEYLGFENVTNASYFVYVMALFDSFLSDTTKFLLLLKPEALGQECKVPLSAVLAARSRSAIITDEVIRRVKKIGYQSFSTRLEFLENRFAFQLGLSSEVIAGLERFADLRNAVVHDLGTLSLSLDADQELVVELRSCPLHPASVERNIVLEAAESFLQISSALHVQVMDSVLNAADTKEFSRTRNFFEVMVNSATEKTGPT